MTSGNSRKVKEFDFLLTLENYVRIIALSFIPHASFLRYVRLFANSGSLQNLRCGFRNALENYHYLDMKNTHPEILYQYCTMNGIKGDILTEYIHNSDDILESIQGAGKTMFLKIMNGRKTEIDNPFLVKFKEEIKLIDKNLYCLNPELFKFKSFKLRKEYDA